MSDKLENSTEKKVYAEALRKATQDYEELVGGLSVLRLLNDSFQVGLGFTDICRKLVEFVTGTMNIENASVMVMDHEKGELRLLAAKNFYEDQTTAFVDTPWPGKAFKLGEGIAGQVAKSRKSILINDTQEEPRFVKAEAQRVNVRSILCLPLIHADRLHGVLNLSNSEAGAFDRRKEHALSIIASATSVALSHATAVEKLKQYNKELTVRNKELGAVIALSESLHTNLDLDAVLKESLKNVLDGFEIDTAAVFLEHKKSGAMELRSYQTRSAEPGVESLLRSLGEQFGQNIIGSRKPVSYFGPFEEATDKEACSPGCHTCVGVPLLSGEVCFGILMTLGSNETGLDRAKIRLLSSFCNQISVAIHNSILVSRLRQNIEELHKTRYQLIQSEKLASLGEMISGVAHEINNPLAAIMGYSELLLGEKSLSQESQTMLEKIILCVDRSRKIVHGLLSFARKTELQKKEVNVNELIDKVLEHREYDLTINNIEIVKHYETHAPLLILDPHQMEQVFFNLINNAFDSMAGREVPGKLEIRTRLVEDSAMQIEFIDNGHGIKEGDRSKVFEPFFTTKEVGKGTGLGLSVSYGIIKEHGGNLFLDESHSDGTKIVIVLPIVRTPQPAGQSVMEEDIPEPSRSGGKILVVDDEEIVAEFMRMALSSRGFVVDCATNGEKAYGLLVSNRYDLIITDIRMPGEMDGRDLFVRVQAESPEMANRFVFITGDIMEKETAKFLKESGKAFLLKPFSIKDLQQVVDKTLQEVAA
ncbi:MAG: GAF domain-containing protein [Candidatus Hydrogenedentota bacterium]|nr:MAG: GAF domain-containing protein [Candidatus Hydrogenedentota bacterium]